MAAKTLDEAIIIAMTTVQTSDFKERLKTELRDLFAHQGMIFVAGSKKEIKDKDPMKALIDDTIDSAVDIAITNFIRYMFSDVPAVRSVK